MTSDTSPIPALTAQQVEQLRRDLGIRPHRPRRALAAVVVLAALAAGIGAGYAVAHAHPRTVTRTRTAVHTVTRTRHVTRWRTRTITQQAAPSIPCQDVGGTPEPGVITAGMPGDTTCTVALLSPMGADHLAQVQLTAPNGDTSTWNLANPYG